MLEALSIPGKKEIGYLISCGLNLKTSPQKALYPTTSFQNEGIYLSLEEVLPKLAASFEQYKTLWLKEGFAPIRRLWLQHAINLEKMITIHVQDKDHTGILKGIDETGALILETKGGTQKYSAGDILEGGPHASRH